MITPPPLPKISTVLLLSHTQTQIHHGCGNHHKHSRNGSPHLTPFRNPGCPIFYCNFPITRRYLPALVPSVRMKFDRLLSDMSSHFGLWVSRTDPKSLFSVCVCSCFFEFFGRNYPLKRNKPETYLSVLQKQTWVTPRGSVLQAKTLRWLTTSRFRLPFMPAIILCEQVSTVFKGPRLEVNSLKIHQELPSQAITPVCLANQDKMWNIPGKRLEDVLKSVSKKRNRLNVDALHSNLEGCSWISRTFPESR